MKKLVVTSTRKSAGKTTVCLGLTLNLFGKTRGYFKPLADRMTSIDGLRVDSDIAFFKDLLSLKDPLDSFSEITDYTQLIRDSEADPEKTATLIKARFEAVSRSRDVMLVEGPINYSYGAFAHTSSKDLGKSLKAPGLIVADGEVDVVIDKTMAAALYYEASGAKVLGVVLNKVPQNRLDEFKELASDALKRHGIPVLGVVPFEQTLARVPVRDIVSALSPKVLAGHDSLHNEIQQILIGAASCEAAMKAPLFTCSPNRLVITSGDRTDVLLAAIETRASCILLTNNILPEPIVRAKADEAKVPLLLVAADTFRAANQVEAVEPIFRADEKQKVEKVRELAKKHIDIKRILDAL